MLHAAALVQALRAEPDAQLDFFGATGPFATRGRC